MSVRLSTRKVNEFVNRKANRNAGENESETVRVNSRQLNYYFRHKDKIRLSKRDYYIRNRDDIRESHRKYYVENKDNLKDYYLRNKDSTRESKRRYYIRKKENPETYLSYLARETENKSWKSPELVREYFESVANQLHISDYSDWYRISRPQMLFYGGMFSFLFYALCFY
jgi:hypothetical protein